MKVYYTPEALNDLKNTKESIIRTFNDVELANKILRMITKSVRNLEIFPNMGTEVQLSGFGFIGYLYLFVKKNYVFYHVENENIRIIRILNEKQDYMRILFGVSEEEIE